MDKVAICCRLSKEDQDKIADGDDSESIQNQKLLLVDYAINRGWQIYKIYSDDDYSGSDLTRPEWNQMIKDAEAGLFNIVLCKSQARFARSTEVVEKYIHGLFLEWGIRFISVVDNIDTKNKATKKASQINGLVDQWYIEDLSENIRSVFRAKMEKGQYLGSFAAYGYMKNPDDHHALVIDVEAANTVRIIFELSMQGYGVSVIGQKLTALGIPTPTEYKKSLGLNYKNPNGGRYTDKGIWSTTTIKKILNNPIYIGTLIQGREKKVSYKSKKVMISPKEEWIIKPNNHEAIISEEMFNKTQEFLKIRRKSCKTTAGHKFIPHLFSGRIKCADCGSTMAKTSGRLAGGYDYFICQLAKKSKLANCTRHSIRYNELEKYVNIEIKKLIKEVLSYHGNMDKLKKKFGKQKKDREEELKITANLDRLNHQIGDIKQSLSSLYVDKVKGIITEADFGILKEGLSVDVEKLNAQKSLLEDNLNKLKESDEKINSFEDAVNKYANYEKLTFEIVNDFIECIYIHETDKEGKQEIEIHWNI